MSPLIQRSTPTPRRNASIVWFQKWLVLLATFCTLASTYAQTTDAPPALITRVAAMPNSPAPYALRDWAQVTRNYLDLVFDFDQHGPHLPLIRWTDSHHTNIWMPAYVGNPDGTESINYLAAIISGSLVGLDMRNFHGHDWVNLATNFYNPTDGVYLDWAKGPSGGSFWYDVLPNVFYFQLTDLYPGNPVSQHQLLDLATRWYQACLVLRNGTNSTDLPNFDHTGFNLRTMQPFDNGERIEPEGAAGIAWLEYMAWTKSPDPRFLAAADWSLRALQNKSASPLYEVLLPYSVITAARLNAEHGSNYDVGKLINWCFDPQPAPQARPNWGVLTGTWSGLDVDGLVGSATDGGGYAFAMNSFQYAGTLAPLARYDPRYAHDLGKWILNLANAARLFYANAHDPAHQSSYDWASTYDTNSAIAYEGLRKWKRSDTTTARSDFRNVAGKIVSGDFLSTRYYREEPPQTELLEETTVSNRTRLDHTWDFDLPDTAERFLVVAAERLDHGHRRNAFRFSYATHPDGPYTEAFTIPDTNLPQVLELPSNLHGKLYLKVESTDRSRNSHGRDQLSVDAMAISYCSDIGPYAQGDLIVSFINLLKSYTVPIVLYRPATVVTDLGLYGSADVGNLGGLIKPTNIEKILRLDLLKTDYFHAPAYPTYLYYNPYPTAQVIDLELGEELIDIYDTTTKDFLLRHVNGHTQFTLPPDTARVLVLAPANGTLTHDGPRTLINNTVVDYRN